MAILKVYKHSTAIIRNYLDHVPDYINLDHNQ